MKNIFLLCVLLGNLGISGIVAQNNNSASAIQERIINLDFNKIKGNFNTIFKECIGAGRANEGLRADWQ